MNKMVETIKQERKGLRGFLEDKFLSIGLEFFNEFEISEKFEELLYEGLGGELQIYSEKLPLYINSNWQSINERILKNEGKVKITTYEKPKLPKMLTKHPEFLQNIEIYKLDQNPNFSASLLYDNYEILSGKDKFFLREFPATQRVKDYNSFFNRANLKLQKINIEDYFK